jgi:hypothetical protein
METSTIKTIHLSKNIEDSVNKISKDIKRVESKNWNFNESDYFYENQFKNIVDIHSNNYKYINENTKIVIQQINKKIHGYKQQDTIKKLLNNEKFITFKCLIDKMFECKLKCYYCNIEMFVLYDILREVKQWTVDRIDNNLGHNYDNFYLACLECNLKRRRRNDEKFLFTKQIKLIKIKEEEL